MSITDLAEYRENKEPHIVAELMCVGCLHRWVGVYPSGSWLSDLECPHCFKTGAIIKTGQDIEDELMEARK